MLHDPGSYTPPSEKVTIELSDAEKDVLKKLAEEIAVIAREPVHAEKAALWTRLNDLKSERPMVWINEIPWHEMNVDDELTLQCQDAWARELETLRQINLRLTSSLEPNAVIAAIVAGISELMPQVWHANIFLRENNRLVFGTEAWANEESRLTLLPPSPDGPINQVVESGEIILTPEIPLHHLFDDLSDEGLCGTLIGIPLKMGDRVDGVMNVVYADPHAVAATELHVLNLLGDQAALAMENARRYQDVDRLVSLLASEQYRLEGLIEMLPVGVLLLDSDHNLLVTNSLAREFIRVLAPQDSGQTLPRLSELPITEILARHTEALPIEIVLDAPPASRIFEVQAQYIATDMPQWVVILRDITQEREIQDRVQMQERLATVGQLAAGIAHDFNNIMAAIVVYADLLLMDKGLSPSSRERLIIIQQQVERAASLIRQILDFSRRSVMEQSSLDLLPLLKEIEKLLARTLPETVSVQLSYQDGEYSLIADPTRMRPAPTG